MKLRVKIHGHQVLRLTLTLPEPADPQQQQLTLRDVAQHLEHDALLLVGYRLTGYDLSLNGIYTLADQLHEQPLAKLGLVSGDLLHVLNSRWLSADGQTIDADFQLQQNCVSDLPDAHPPPEQPATVADCDRTGAVPTVLAWLVLRRCGTGGTGGSGSSGEEARQQTLAALPAERLLFLALHVLTLETGLEPALRQDAAAAADDDVHSEQHWELAADSFAGPGGLMRQRYWWSEQRPPLGDTVTLSAVALGGVLAVHASLAGAPRIFSVQLPLTDYVRRVPLAQLAAAGAASRQALAGARYTNMRRLTNLFRNAITVPLLVHMRRARGQVSPHEWRALPHEVQLMVMRQLAVGDLMRLGATCRQLHQQTAHPLLWKWLVLRDFPLHRQLLADHLQPHADWQWRYQQLHLQRHQRAAANSERQARLPRPGTLPFELAPDEWPPLAAPLTRTEWLATAKVGVIGGDYDRVPGLDIGRAGPPPLALPFARLLPHPPFVDPNAGRPYNAAGTRRESRSRPRLSVGATAGFLR